MELTVHDGTLELRAAGEQVRALPLRLVERIVLRSDTRLSSQTLASLADAGIGLIAFGGRGGQRVAHLVGWPTSDCQARLAQAHRALDEQWAAQVALRLVTAKARRQTRLLEQHLALRPDLRKPLGDAIQRIATCLSEMEGCEQLDRLLGLEGAAAAGYFRGLTHLFAPALEFTARRRRPPPDPVNACLSLGYTLLHGQAVQACWQSGLDPMMGFLHRPAPGRASLACDVMEPWRIEVDQWAVEAFRDRLLRVEHFGRDGAGACIIGKTGRSHVYTGLSVPLRRAATGMRRHVRLLASALRKPLDTMFSAVPDGWPGDAEPDDPEREA